MNKVWLSHNMADCAPQMGIRFRFAVFLLPMSRLTQTPPLFSLNSEENEPGNSPSCKLEVCFCLRCRPLLFIVRTHVNEPFIRRPESKRTQTTMQLLALFGHLELVLTQINRLRRDQKAFTAKTDDWLEVC